MKVEGLKQLKVELDKRLLDAVAWAGKGVEVGFGTAYSVFVHENLEARHYPPHGTGGQAKYLEQPARERQQELGAIVADAVKAGRTPLQAIYLAGLTLQGWAQALTPVETGVLRASAYTRIVDGTHSEQEGGTSP